MIETIKNEFYRRYKDSVVNNIMESNNFYIVSIQPKNWDDNKMITGNFFKINKETLDIEEYSPVRDPEEFKKALQNTVYIRNK